MIIKCILALIPLTLLLLATGCQNKPPEFLYKVVSRQAWEDSQDSEAVVLTEFDREFIHLATVDQLERIITKYFADEPQYVVLKLDTGKLPGRLVYESNPGGATKYYHLYDGTLPLAAVVEVSYRTR